MKWFGNLKITKKLLLGFSAVLIVAVALGAVGMVNMQKIAANDQELYVRNTVAIGYLTEITTAFQRLRVNLRNVILETDPAKIADNEQQIVDRRADLNTLQEKFAKLIISEEVQKTFDTFVGARKVFGGYLEQVVALGEQNKNAEAAALLGSDEVKVAEDNEQNAIITLTQLLDQQAADRSNENSALAQTSIYTMAGALAFGILLAILLALGISRTISKSMRKIVLSAEGIAEGNLSVDVAIHTRDEIGELANAFRKMTANLNDVLSDINAAAEQVSLGAGELSDSSMSLSQGASEQASAIEEVTASLEQITAQTRMNAQNASEANKLAGVARGNAEQGNGQMKEMLRAMEEINESSSNISKIIKVIDDIAFQTNILALNAAVEAARAGQHGKGFAVVAEEVRNLAAKSANAAKETTEMIEGSIKKVEVGTKLASHTAEALGRILDGVAQTASLVSQIDLASNEQSIGLSQVNQAIVQVSQVVQANSAVSEQSAAASKELAGQAASMRESVGKFRLKGQEQETKRKPQAVAPKAKVIPERKEEPPKKPAGKAVIALSDEEFGKY